MADFRGGTEVRFADIDAVLNAPIQSSPYVEAYLEHGGLKKVVADGGGGCMRVNPVCGSGFSLVCNHCGKNLIKIRKCSACGIVGYCDRECQKAGWKAHKPICKEMRKNNTEAGPEVGLKATSTSSISKLSKWLTMVPGFAGSMREHAEKSPYQGDQVPFFLIEGGTNPFVCCVRELTGEERDKMLELSPEARHHCRPLSQFEKERNAAQGTRTIAHSACRGSDACLMRARV